jgi:hypothetical protein
MQRNQVLAALIKPMAESRPRLEWVESRLIIKQRQIGWNEELILGAFTRCMNTYAAKRQRPTPTYRTTIWTTSLIRWAIHKTYTIHPNIVEYMLTCKII